MGSIFFTQTITNGNSSENLVRNFSSESYFHREGMLIAALQRPNEPIRGEDSDVITVSGRPAKVIEAEYLCPLLPDNPLETTDFFAHAKTDSVELIEPSRASTSNVNCSSVRYRFQAALDEQNNLISYQLLAVDTNGRLSIPHVSWRGQIVNFLTFAEQAFLDKLSYVVGNDPGQFRLQLLDRADQKLNEGVTYSIDRKDFLYQYAAVSTFKAGGYDGNLTLGELKKRGDFGLGTFNGVDGELVVNQGKFYRIHSSGTVSEVSDCDHTSLAFVKFFKVDLSFTIQTADITMEQLQKKIASLLTDDSLYAIRIKGTFSKLTARASALAQKPYQPLEEHLTQNQVIFNLSNTTGVAVGFLVPTSMEKVNIPGFHFHYIADDLTSGGHVFDFTANQLTVEIDKTKGCYLELNAMAIPEK
ncbi:acetolactate decarboxylase [Dyadobacter sp. MSC1_007]|jgi:acetolactate decarboxylase|uniref:acetolactate decarboxylase n=1 Tax=Dyadobacter sp. MSC1_007 TaxID=2909264 RepID=UPI00202EF484|nr:acetolactate decarboxylase [Dyadobacter sp. MSC1_007]